jgi:polysaccharide export outer membrane protein
LNKPKLLVVLRVVGCAMLAACATTGGGYPYAQEPDPRRAEYVIGVTDALSVRVWRNNELNTDPTVMPDGTITVPLIGQVVAAGKTPTEVRKAITQALSAYIKDQSATVTVAVARVNSYRITVSGNVARPGVLEATRYLTVSEAIALAGGPTRFAEPSGTVLIRTTPDGTVRRIPIEYDQVEAGRMPEQDLVLLRGDRVYVP